MTDSGILVVDGLRVGPNMWRGLVERAEFAEAALKKEDAAGIWDKSVYKARAEHWAREVDRLKSALNQLLTNSSVNAHQRLIIEEALCPSSQSSMKVTPLPVDPELMLKERDYP